MDWLRRALIVNPRKRAPYGQVVPTGSLTSGPVPVFITLQSFKSFPTMTLVISVIWALFRMLANWGSSPWVPVGISLLFGTVAYSISVDEKPPETVKNHAVAAAIALANSLMLAASVLGVGSLSSMSQGAK